MSSGDIVFVSVKQRYRIPYRIFEDLIVALDESKPLPLRIAIVRFWAIYLSTIGLAKNIEVPKPEEITPKKLDSIVAELAKYVARALGFEEEYV